MNQMIYLDNAATSYPKPKAVREAILRCMEEAGGNPGRGSHRLSLAAAETVYRCREEVASLFESDSPERVVFTPNCTTALNTVIKGLLRRGDHVLLSDLEHNAVYRPIYHLQERGMITYDVFPSFAGESDATPEKICRGIERLIRPETKLLVCTHASNVCGAVLPLIEIGKLCRKHRILFVVDAAQSAGHYRISMKEMGISALCAPGHKGLLGLQGSGFFLLGDGVMPEPLTEGGNGMESLSGRMAGDSPERYEAGTLATPAIAGLCAGIGEVKSIGLETVADRERKLVLALEERLENVPGVHILAPGVGGNLLSFYSEKVQSESLALALGDAGFCVRGGFHCSALAHRTLQTPRGGAVRVSPGLDTRLSDVDRFAGALKEILG